MFWDYELPPDLIAQQPVEPRDASRLLCLDCDNGRLTHRVFRDLPDILLPGDLLVLNDTRVLPARIVGRREKTGGKWEALFLRATAEGVWEMLAQCGGKPEPGEALIVSSNVSDVPFRLIYRGRSGDCSLFEPAPSGTVIDLLERFGRMPLPPYIRKGVATPEDKERYQTVFNKVAGSVAAPTAGLHFTTELLERLRTRGIDTASVTLHVGLGTFEPIRTSDPREHVIHAEWAKVPAETTSKILKCKAQGGRVVAVGTTACRALEAAAINAGDNLLQPWEGETGLFIYPPYRFRIVDALITNFHLPKTTLLLLVAALAGEENLRRAYESAIEAKYRFYSYGDAMLIASGGDKAPHSQLRSLSAFCFSFGLWTAALYRRFCFFVGFDQPNEKQKRRQSAALQSRNTSGDTAPHSQLRSLSAFCFSLGLRRFTAAFVFLWDLTSQMKNKSGGQAPHSKLSRNP